jgi:hypothetical protein
MSATPNSQQPAAANSQQSPASHVTTQMLHMLVPQQRARANLCKPVAAQPIGPVGPCAGCAWARSEEPGLAEGVQLLGHKYAQHVCSAVTD